MMLIALWFAVPDNTNTDIKTTKDEPCYFPFLFQAQFRTECVQSPNDPTKTWCSLTEDFDRDGQWGFCKTDDNKEEDEEDGEDEDDGITKEEGDDSGKYSIYNL